MSRQNSELCLHYLLRGHRVIIGENAYQMGPSREICLLGEITVDGMTSPALIDTHMTVGAFCELCDSAEFSDVLPIDHDINAVH